MDGWLPYVVTPTIVLIFALVVAIYMLAKWYGKVDSHMTTVIGFMEEIRNDLKNISSKWGAR